MDTPAQAHDAPVLETERLLLRHVDAGDAAFVLELVNDPDWLRYIGDRGVRTLDDARRYIDDGPRRMYAQHGFGLFLVERRVDGAAMGLCGLLRRDTLPDVDIGFAFAPGFRGQGYAYEAAAATLQYARDQHRLDRVIAITSQDNRASQRLLERLGLCEEGNVRLGAETELLRLYGTRKEFARSGDERSSAR